MLLGIFGQMQIEHSRTARRHQPLGLRQGKAQTGPAIADVVCKYLLHQPSGQSRKRALFGMTRPLRCIQQSRFALDIGNDIPQRGKALLLFLGLHLATT